MDQTKDKLFYVKLMIALFFMFGFRFIPSPDGLSQSGMQVIGIFIGVLILWLTIAIDWPSLLMMGALALVPELKFSNILSGSFGNTTFVFLIFTFILTYALGKTSILKKIAIGFITSKYAMKGPWAFVVLYSASILFLGLFISPSVLFFIYLPIHESIMEILGLTKGHKLGALLMISNVIMCGVSSGMTPIAHVFPLIAMGLYTDMVGLTIDYARYMMVAIPVGLIIFGLTMLVFRFVLKPDMSSLNNMDVTRLKAMVQPSSSKDKLVLTIFILVIALWVLPSLLLLILPQGELYALLDWFDSLGTAMPPLIGVVLLCVIHVDGKPLLNISDAMAHGVSWSSLLMCAGTLAIGSALTNTDIGFTTWLSTTLSPLIQTMPVMIMVLIFALWSGLQTNLSSNMVTATLVSSAALTITSGIDTINIAVLIILIGMLSAYAFATPPAMPCVAIAASSGWTTTKQMMCYGFTIMILSILVATFIGYPIGCLLF